MVQHRLIFLDTNGKEVDRIYFNVGAIYEREHLLTEKLKKDNPDRFKRIIKSIGVRKARVFPSKILKLMAFPLLTYCDEGDGLFYLYEGKLYKENLTLPEQKEWYEKYDSQKEYAYVAYTYDCTTCHIEDGEFPDKLEKTFLKFVKSAIDFHKKVFVRVREEYELQERKKEK